MNKEKIKRKQFDNKTMKGVDNADIKAISFAMQNGEPLTIDGCGHVYNSNDRWIADAMVRSRK
ncbi:MAG: hypothetical protein IKK88_00280 [Oscillospiraceae bacterium]|nr:hypothetical protein [Oscillospiraceae bacterium]